MQSKKQNRATIIFLAVIFLLVGHAQAATLTVTTNLDITVGVSGCADGCSLREALNVSANGDTVNFDATFFSVPRTITLTSGQISLLGSNKTIAGPGANLLTINGNNADRIFQFQVTNLTLSGMTLTGGNAASIGGAIYFNGGSNYTITNCHIIGNTAADIGGAIYSQNASLTIMNSTISGNTSNIINGNTSGGIYYLNQSNNTLTIVNSTIIGNNAPNGDNNGGGILATGGVGVTTATITNSTIAKNTTVGTASAGGIRVGFGTPITVRNSIVADNQSTTRPDVVAFSTGTFVSNGYNIIGNRGIVTVFNQTGDQTGTGAMPLDPLLNLLADNGGQTPTHSFSSSMSPAIDKGESSGSTTDQRGQTRPVVNPSVLNASGGDSADIGAFEVQPALQFSAANYSVNENGATATITVTRTGGATCTAGIDFINTSGTLSFADGVASQTFNVTICDDALVESSEIINLSLSMPIGATLGTPSTAVLTIIDNDLPPTPTPTPPIHNVCTPTTTVTEGDLFPCGIVSFGVSSGPGSVTVDHVNAGTGLQSLTVTGIPVTVSGHDPCLRAGNNCTSSCNLYDSDAGHGG